MEHEFRMLLAIGIDNFLRHRVEHDQPRPTVLHEFARYRKYRLRFPRFFAFQVQGFMSPLFAHAESRSGRARAESATCSRRGVAATPIAERLDVHKEISHRFVPSRVTRAMYLHRTRFMTLV